MFQYSVKNNIGYLLIDLEGSKVNLLNASFTDQFHKVWDKIEKESDINGLVIYSGKKDNFIAGADINMLQQCQSEEEAAHISEQAQTCFDRIEKSALTVVAAIHGACAGGGLELALACDFRVVSNDKKTKLSAPEVTLGLIPGGGGTYRLPRLIGLDESLSMMLTGKAQNPEMAKRQGLVDEIVSHSILLDVATKFAYKPQNKAPRLKNTNWNDWAKHKAIDSNTFGRSLAIKQARKQMLKKTRGLYPAPKKLIELIEKSFDLSVDEALSLERKIFGELLISWQSYNLRGLFLAGQELAKENKKASTKHDNINQIGVIGAGLMGSGIAYISATSANLPVRFKDLNEEKLSMGLKSAYELLEKGIKHKKITDFEGKKRFLNIGPTIDYSGFQKADLVIEAVFEDLSLKQKILSELRSHCKKDFVFATNTSAIPIHEIAKDYDKQSHVVGMHYFSPVHKMPLLEIVEGKTTSKTALNHAITVGLKQGKKIIVVGDSCGFYTTRILTAFLTEAMQILYEGAPLEFIDECILNLGFPMGPFELIDEIGIDVTVKIAKFMKERMGDDFNPQIDLESVQNIEKFYEYEKGKAKKANEKSVETLQIPSSGSRNPAAGEIQGRCLNRFVRESVLCLEENVIASPRDGDIGAIYGLGFPPFEGGPFRYIDRIGARDIKESLDKLQKTYGKRFKAPKTIEEMSKDNRTFYDSEEIKAGKEKKRKFS